MRVDGLADADETDERDVVTAQLHVPRYLHWMVASVPMTAHDCTLQRFPTSAKQLFAEQPGSVPHATGSFSQTPAWPLALTKQKSPITQPMTGEHDSPSFLDAGREHAAVEAFPLP